MPDKKLTDNEIKKALECCSDDEPHFCSVCPYYLQDKENDYCREDMNKDALSLINRLQAENERLKNCVKSEDEVRDIAKRTMEPLVKEITREQIDIAVKLAKTEAYKECIEKVNNIINEIYNKHIFGSNDLSDEEKDAVINFSDDVTYALDNLLKEMVGENNA